MQRVAHFRFDYHGRHLGQIGNGCRFLWLGEPLTRAGLFSVGDEAGPKLGERRRPVWEPDPISRLSSVVGSTAEGRDFIASEFALIH